MLVCVECAMNPGSPTLIGTAPIPRGLRRGGFILSLRRRRSRLRQSPNTRCRRLPAFVDCHAATRLAMTVSWFNDIGNLRIVDGDWRLTWMAGSWHLAWEIFGCSKAGQRPRPTFAYSNKRPRLKRQMERAITPAVMPPRMPRIGRICMKLWPAQRTEVKPSIDQ